jgi:hypothetical protein
LQLEIEPLRSCPWPKPMVGTHAAVVCKHALAMLSANIQAVGAYLWNDAGTC